MAYDKIIPIRRRLSRCVNYVLNEEKTSLASVLEYAENPAKTQQLVTGINCTPETALSEMNATKRRWDKKGGVLGYHIIHSYVPSEVTPEEAHAAGVEFAQRLLGDRYEVIVATHLDRKHLHCHIVFNSVSFVDGRKYRDDFKSYFEDLRGTSNEVSRERGLSVIETDGRGRHYSEWRDQRSGKGTIRGLVRQDIDAAIAESFTFESFLSVLKKQGYTIKYGANVKHTALRSPDGERFFRLDSLGDGYTEDDIRARLTAARNGENVEADARALTPLPIMRTSKRYTVRKGTIRKRRLSGFRALYTRWLYILSGRKTTAKTKASFAVRKEVSKLQRYSCQFRFLLQYRIDTDKQLTMLGEALQGQIDLLTDYRRELYERRRSGCDVDAELANINEKLRNTRRELKLCRQIAEDIPRIRGNMREKEIVKTEEKARKERKGKWM